MDDFLSISFLTQRLRRMRSERDEQQALVPVRKLYVSKLPPNTTNLEIRRAFEIFGPIEQIKRHFSHKINAFAFVTFTHACDALKACTKSKKGIKIRQRKVYVAKADSWHQPTNYADPWVNACLPSSSDMATNVTDTPTNDTTILSLNDDCLLHLFKYLSPIKNYSNLSLVCIRFKELIGTLAKTVNTFDFQKEVDTNGIISVIDFYRMMAIIGPYVTKIDISQDHFNQIDCNYLSIINRSCRQLDELSMRHFQQLCSFMWSTFPSTLTSLCLENCYVKNKMVRHIARNCPNIERLNLSRNTCLTGIHINKLKKLTSLKLSHCQNVLGKHLEAIILANGSLKLLHAAKCDKLGMTSMRLVIQHLPLLEELSLTPDHMLYSESFMTEFATLKHLKVLRLYGFNVRIDGMVFGLAEHNTIEELDVSFSQNGGRLWSALNKLTKLKRLALGSVEGLDDVFFKNLVVHNLVEFRCCGIDAITDDAVVDIVPKAPNLVLLDISNCLNVSDNLISKILPIVNERANPSPLMMCVGFTKIKKVKSDAIIAADNKDRLILVHSGSRMLERLDDDLFALLLDEIDEEDLDDEDLDYEMDPWHMLDRDYYCDDSSDDPDSDFMFEFHYAG